jgi:hypothetical protein
MVPLAESLMGEATLPCRCSKEGSGQPNQQPTIARGGGGSYKGGGGGGGDDWGAAGRRNRGPLLRGLFGNNLLGLYDNAGSFQVKDDTDEDEYDNGYNSDVKNGNNDGGCTDNCRTAHHKP